MASYCCLPARVSAWYSMRLLSAWYSWFSTVRSTSSSAHSSIAQCCGSSRACCSMPCHTAPYCSISTIRPMPSIRFSMYIWPLACRGTSCHCCWLWSAVCSSSTATSSSSMSMKRFLRRPRRNLSTYRSLHSSSASVWWANILRLSSSQTSATRPCAPVASSAW